MTQNNYRNLFEIICHYCKDNITNKRCFAHGKKALCVPCFHKHTLGMAVMVTHY